MLSVMITFSVTINHYTTKETDVAYRFRVLRQYLDNVAYYDPDYDAMLNEALKAYVGSSGDPYTVYYDAEEFAALNDRNEGHYVGIGVTVEKTETGYQSKLYRVMKITAVREGSAAQKAGIRVGDEIYAITADEKTTLLNDVSYTKASELIRGEVGTSVGLSLFREEDKEKKQIEISVLRETILTETVTCRISETDPSVGIVTIPQFDLTTPQALKTCMNLLIEQGIGRFVFDLRDNGGGDLASVIACASYFLQKGDVILSTADKAGRKTVYKTEVRKNSDEYVTCDVSENEIGMYRGYSFTVLINGNTASAAELLTAVFRDYSLGTIIGEKSYGKGSMQSIYSLSRFGIDGGLKVTTRLYFPPCGEGYNQIGITPDIVVVFPEGKTLGQLSEKEDTQIQAAIAELCNKNS